MLTKIYCMFFTILHENTTKYFNVLIEMVARNKHTHTLKFNHRSQWMKNRLPERSHTEHSN